MRPICLFSFLAFTALYLSAQADEISGTCGTAPAPRRASVRHIESQGVGYNQGYTSIDLFIASNHPMNRLIPFFDGRLHLFNDGKPAVNVGLGARYLSSSWVYGINSYYDYRKTTHFHYNQVAVGLEALGKRLDVRWNGYLPVGKKKSALYHTQFSHFQEHSAYLKSKQEFAMRGMNLEGGCHLRKMKYATLYAAAGPYYFYNAGKHAIGGEMRVSATLYDCVRLEVSGSYDPIFHGIGQGQVSLILPFGPKTSVNPQKNRSCSHEMVVRERALQPVDRSEIIVVDHQRKITQAIDPDTGVPYTFFFVNNTSSSSGTFESPYPTLAHAQAASHPGDIIYVFEGNGNSYDVGAGFYMQHHQKLWGSGTAQHLNTTLGVIPIGNQTGGMPRLIGDGVDSYGLINLSNHNEVSGIHLTGNGTTRYGILGGDGTGFSPTNTALSIDHALIQNNRIDGQYTSASVRLAASGTVILFQNTIDYFTDDSFACVELYSLGSDNLTAIIANNTISASSTGTFGISGLSLESDDTSTFSAIVNNNTLSVSGTGSFFSLALGLASANTSTFSAIVNNNTLSVSSTGSEDIYGVSLFSTDASVFSADMNSHTISARSTGYGDVYGVGLESRETSSLSANGNSHTISTHSNGYIYALSIVSLGSSSLISNENQHTIFASSTGNGDIYGVSLESRETSSLTMSGNSHTVSASSTGTGNIFGVGFVSRNLSVISTHWNNNTLSVSSTGAGRVSGVSLDPFEASSVNMYWNSNTLSVSSTGNGAVYGLSTFGSFSISTNTSSVTLGLENNTISTSSSGNGRVYGASLEARDFASMNSSLNNNTISTHSTGTGRVYGTRIVSNNASSVNAIVSGGLLTVRGSGTEAYGIFASAAATTGKIQNNTGTVGGATTNTPITITGTQMTQSNNTIVTE